ncbi:MAG: DUF1836 domain-containing protein [Clostridium sp.]|nr:DUF1836 domain-containing protein [Clostridium sp.]MDY3827974.1 DUF1836 domain-containing protein [Clostridium sp.]
MKNEFDFQYIKNLTNEMAKNNLIAYKDLPRYNLFLSQVIDFLNDKFEEDNYTNNIVQNYIKSNVISKPEEGKKKGYSQIHLIQLILLSYMRPILTSEEIKKVFKLAFNEINDRTDDIISWETAYKIFTETQKESYESFLEVSLGNEEKLNSMIDEFNLNDSDKEKIRIFIIVISLIAQASVIKKLVQRIVNEFNVE